MSSIETVLKYGWLAIAIEPSQSNVRLWSRQLVSLNRNIISSAGTTQPFKFNLRQATNIYMLSGNGSGCIFAIQARDKTILFATETSADAHGWVEMLRKAWLEPALRPPHTSHQLLNTPHTILPSKIASIEDHTPKSGGSCIEDIGLAFYYTVNIGTGRLDTHLELTFHGREKCSTSIPLICDPVATTFQVSMPHLGALMRLDVSSFTEHAYLDKIVIESNSAKWSFSWCAPLPFQEKVTLLPDGGIPGGNSRDDDLSKDGACDVTCASPTKTTALQESHTYAIEIIPFKESSEPLQVTFQGELGSAGPIVIEETHLCPYTVVAYEIDNIHDIGTLRNVEIVQCPGGVAKKVRASKVFVKNTTTGQELLLEDNDCQGRQSAEIGLQTDEYGTIDDHNKEEEEEAPSLAPSSVVGPNGHYRVVFHTSQGCAAGLPKSTRIFFEIIGSEGNSGVHWLQRQPRSFRRKSIDGFEYFSLPYLGEVQKIRVGTNGRGGLLPISRAWHLKTVEIRHISSGKSWLLPLQGWIKKRHHFARWIDKV